MSIRTKRALYGAFAGVAIYMVFGAVLYNLYPKEWIVWAGAALGCYLYFLYKLEQKLPLKRSKKL
jgi:uncharacterized membrane protein YdjX (TVP38/TMEM64 family)